jgi:hypothetical protein
MFAVENHQSRGMAFMHAKLQEVVIARLKKYGIGNLGTNIAEKLSGVVLNSNGKCARMCKGVCQGACSKLTHIRKSSATSNVGIFARVIAEYELRRSIIHDAVRECARIFTCRRGVCCYNNNALGKNSVSQDDFQTFGFLSKRRDPTKAVQMHAEHCKQQQNQPSGQTACSDSQWILCADTVW